MEQRSGNKKQKSNKLMGCLGVVVIILVVAIALPFIFGDSSPKEETKKHDYTESNSKVIEAKDEKSRASVIAEKQIKELYSIDNFKVNYTDSSFKVFRMPDDKNSETGQEYKNLYSVIGNFTWQDTQYHFSMLYSMTDEDNYTVISLTSNFNNDVSIDIPIESDK